MDDSPNSRHSTHIIAPDSAVLPSAFRYTRRRGEIALTFDDGPNPGVTPRILDLLDRYAVRATFFLIGRFVRHCQGLVREIAARGHTLGNHTDTHPGLTMIPLARVSEELSRCQIAISSVAGNVPVWMRPPFGLYGPQLRGTVSRVGLRGVVMWSINCGDWKPQPAEQLCACLARVGKSENGGDIVLLHDGDHRSLNGDRGHVVKALEHQLPRWREAGHEFVTVDQLERTKDIR
jgi:peptidoglycan/xylan/chitin deacetylase (PgdA/CDA1 family)